MKPNKWLTLISIPFQMGITIFLFHLLGQWLDDKYNLAGDIAHKVCTLLGVMVALYQVVKQVNKLNKNN